MPLFAYLENVDDNNATNDEIQEAFVNELFIRLQYQTYTPGAVLVNFSEAADRMLLFVSGKVMVEFEHPNVQRESIELAEGDYIGEEGRGGGETERVSLRESE